MGETVEEGEETVAAVALPTMGGLREQQGRLPMPAGVKYLVWMELLVHFALKGIQSVLALFLFDHLQMSEITSTELVHVFLTVRNVSPILGAMLGDAYLGKYSSLLFLAFLQCAGSGILTVTAVPGAEKETRAVILTLTALGLFLIAVGGGGMKPCIPAFGGDQVEELIPKGVNRDRLLRLFFSLYYVGMNAGSFVSTVASPAMRTLDSYLLICSVQFAITGAGILTFWLGRRHYVHRPVTENLLVKIFKIIRDGLAFQVSEWWQRTGSGSAEHGERQHFLSEDEVVGDSKRTLTKSQAKYQWLDGAKLTHDATSVEEVKVLLRVLMVFSAMPIFWGLFEQQYSKWVFQARSMNREVDWLGGLVLQPDQMPALNPILVLIMIPLFDRAIYPFFEKINIPLPPLRKMVIGMVLAALAFVTSGVLQLAIDNVLMTSTTSCEKFSGPDLCFNPVLGNLSESASSILRVKAFQVAPIQPQLSVLWQLPQYVLITAGEVLINITGLEFAYQQAPPSMKSVVQGAWACTAAAGDLMTFAIVAIIGERVSTANEFFIFAGGCAAATFQMIWISRGYDDSSPIVPDHPDPIPVLAVTATV